MASILVCEPSAEIRELFELLVVRLGHRPLGLEEVEGGVEPHLILLEPAWPEGVAVAASLRRRLEQLPIVCVSICAPGPELEQLAPARYLLKPVRLRELEAAITAALA